MVTHNGLPQDMIGKTMGRTLTMTESADRFIQGLAANNFEINLFTLGGNDRVDLNRSDDLGGGNTVDTGAGNDIVNNFKESGNVIRLGLGNDTYFGRGFGSFSSEISDQIFAGDGIDLISVATFKSLYFGEAGNDTFISVGWQNTFNGGTGVDTISYANRDANSTLGGTGVTVDLAQGFAQTGAFRREQLVSIENAVGSGAGDMLIGNGQANRLTGGGGFDDLIGNAGADRFIFAAVSDAVLESNNFDLIHDFTRAQGDKIQLSAIDADIRAGAAGNQAFTFVGTADFTAGQAGRVRIEVFSDAVLVLGDVNGDGLADFGFAVQGSANLVAGDFIL